MWPTTLRELEEALDVVARNPSTRSLKKSLGRLGDHLPLHRMLMRGSDAGLKKISLRIERLPLQSRSLHLL